MVAPKPIIMNISSFLSSEMFGFFKLLDLIIDCTFPKEKRANLCQAEKTKSTFSSSDDSGSLGGKPVFLFRGEDTV